MNVKDKIKRIVARNPELKDVFISLQDEHTNQLFHKIVEQEHKKVIIIGKRAEEYTRLYELATIIRQGYIHITQVTTVDLLDHYVDRDTGGDEETPSLSTIVDDLVIIKDSRAFVPNKQKSNMIMQVFEQNDQCIYYYKGTQKSFLTEHSALIDYAKDEGIQVYTLKDTVQSTNGEII